MTLYTISYIFVFDIAFDIVLYVVYDICTYIIFVPRQAYGLKTKACHKMSAIIIRDKQCLDIHLLKPARVGANMATAEVPYNTGNQQVEQWAAASIYSTCGCALRRGAGAQGLGAASHGGAGEAPSQVAGEGRRNS